MRNNEQHTFMPMDYKFKYNTRFLYRHHAVARGFCFNCYEIRKKYTFNKTKNTYFLFFDGRLVYVHFKYLNRSCSPMRESASSFFFHISSSRAIFFFYLKKFISYITLGVAFEKESLKKYWF